MKGSKMTFVLVLFLMMNNEVADSKSFVGFDNKQACEQAAAQAIQYYANAGYEVKAACVRPA